MKQKCPIILFAFLGMLLFGCSEIQKATDLITNPSAREIYQRNFKDRPGLFAQWKKQMQFGLEDSIFIALPYTETGKFFPHTFPIYSYTVELKNGQQLYVKMSMDSTDTEVFIDLYKKQNDSTRIFKKVKSSESGEHSFQKEIEESGTYKILVQPEILANTPFQLEIYRKPVYFFPVADGGNPDIHSYWGASREGGARSHEGIDIFAPRGTPVLATTKGRVGSTGNRGLGGKQVWIRDRERNQSLYYAHLDSIDISEGSAVFPGDTIGFVGNTGNARTTAPHLHFGIYKGFGGAINPLYFVLKTKAPEEFTKNVDFAPLWLVNSGSNLRSGPSTNYEILNQTSSQDTLRFLGKTKEWVHARKNNKAYFIYESLVSKLEK